MNDTSAAATRGSEECPPCHNQMRASTFTQGHCTVHWRIHLTRSSHLAAEARDLLHPFLSLLFSCGVFLFLARGKRLHAKMLLSLPSSTALLLLGITACLPSTRASPVVKQRDSLQSCLSSASLTPVTLSSSSYAADAGQSHRHKIFPTSQAHTDIDLSPPQLRSTSGCNQRQAQSSILRQQLESPRPCSVLLRLRHLSRHGLVVRTCMRKPGSESPSDVTCM